MPTLDDREIDAVLVDAGGVLVDPNWELICDLLAAEGVDVPAAELRAAEPSAKRELDDATVIARTSETDRTDSYLARVLRHAGRRAEGADIEAASAAMSELHHRVGVWEVVPSGAVGALDRLRAAGLRLALASNADALLRGKLAELGIAHRFDNLGISAELGVEKPDPRFFTTILDALGVPPQRALHVGDLYEIDVVGARAAGLHAILVDVADLSAGRDVPRIHGLHELPALLGI